ncbi:MAG: VUT family protein [Thermoleophilia bacterium]|nr:VUT family protein [Thermoleophilia bacterium]
MRLAALTGLYVGVVCAAQVGAQKIVELPWTGDAAPGGAPLIGVSLALIELAHRTAPTRAEGFRNAQLMVGMGFLASLLLAVWIAIVDAWTPAFPGQGFEPFADTWRIVGASLAAFAVSETVDNGFGAWLRDRVPDAGRVLLTNAVSIPLDSVVFLTLAFGSLGFLAGQIEAKAVATVVIGVPLVLAIRAFLPQPRATVATA